MLYAQTAIYRYEQIKKIDMSAPYIEHMSRRIYKVLSTREKPSMSAREKLSISAREKSAIRTMRKRVGSKALKLIPKLKPV